MALEPKFLKVYSNATYTPERRLWHAVMLTYLLDLQNAYDDWKGSLNGVQAALAAKINSLRNHVDSDYTEFICNMADIDVDSFRRKANDILDGTDSVNIKSIYY